MLLYTVTRTGRQGTGDGAERLSTDCRRKKAAAQGIGASEEAQQTEAHRRSLCRRKRQYASWTEPDQMARNVARETKNDYVAAFEPSLTTG
jgi:hypothetical protein